MGRQVFRMRKADGTYHEAGVSSGGDGDGKLTFKRSGDSDPTTGGSGYTAVGAIPVSGTNSYNNEEPFYYYKKPYATPMYSGAGGDISGISMFGGSEIATSSTKYSIAVYTSDDNGHPSTILSSIVEFNPQSAYGNNFIQFSSNVTLAANTWYWIIFLGHSGANGGNVNMRGFSGYRGEATQYWGNTGNYANMQYWNTRISGGALPSSFTISSGSAEWRATLANSLPYLVIRFVSDSSGEWA